MTVALALARIRELLAYDLDAPSGTSDNDLLPALGFAVRRVAALSESVARGVPVTFDSEGGLNLDAAGIIRLISLSIDGVTVRPAVDDAFEGESSGARLTRTFSGLWRIDPAGVTSVTATGIGARPPVIGGVVDLAGELPDAACFEAVVYLAISTAVEPAQLKRLDAYRSEAAEIVRRWATQNASSRAPLPRRRPDGFGRTHL